MTKNRSMKIAVLVLALALLTSCFVGSTFAKFTSESTGTATTVVANWAFTLNSTDVTEQQTFTFNLFETITDDATFTADDANVKNGVIAPGTGGKFDIALKNTSDVATKYTITLADGDDVDATVFAGVPLEFSADGADWKNVNDFKITADTFAVDATENATIYWRWAFIEDNENALENADVKVAATITVDQVD